jgi:diaminopimelate decarboxylase
LRRDNAFALLSGFVRELRTDGHAIKHVDLGGGLGIPYHHDDEPPPRPEAYAAIAKRATKDLGCTLIFEPGRLLVGNAGILVTRVIYLKRGEAKTFVIVDAAMNDLVRPTLYEAYHEIMPVREQVAGARRIVADVVGPICESGDFLALGRTLAEPQPGDLLAVMTSGAYGAVQAGAYNSRPLVPEVLVRDTEWALVRPRMEVGEISRRLPLVVEAHSGGKPTVEPRPSLSQTMRHHSGSRNPLAPRGHFGWAAETTIGLARSLSAARRVRGRFARQSLARLLRALCVPWRA